MKICPERMSVPQRLFDHLRLITGPKWYWETGARLGGNIHRAINAGFGSVRSAEPSEDLILQAAQSAPQESDILFWCHEGSVAIPVWKQESGPDPVAVLLDARRADGERLIMEEIAALEGIPVGSAVMIDGWETLASAPAGADARLADRMKKSLWPFISEVFEGDGKGDLVLILVLVTEDMVEAAAPVAAPAPKSAPKPQAAAPARRRCGCGKS